MLTSLKRSRRSGEINKKKIYFMNKKLPNIKGARKTGKGKDLRDKGR